jgi:hypothetical protein
MKPSIGALCLLYFPCLLRQSLHWTVLYCFIRKGPLSPYERRERRMPMGDCTDDDYGGFFSRFFPDRSDRVAVLVSTLKLGKSLA